MRDGAFASPRAASGPPPRWSDVKWWRLEPRAAPLRLYAIGAACLALYASLGKLAYKYVNYVTGTVLKSIKLVPVMIVSVAWLGRSYPPHDYAAAGFLTTSAVMFGLGIAMLDVSPARRRELAENAGDQVEIIALGGRCWAAGDRL